MRLWRWVHVQDCSRWSGWVAGRWLQRNLAPCVRCCPRRRPGLTQEWRCEGSVSTASLAATLGWRWSGSNSDRWRQRREKLIKKSCEVSGSTNIHAVIRETSSSHYISLYSITCCWLDVSLSGFGKILCCHCSDLRVSVTSDKFNKQHHFSLKYEECWEPKENSWNSFEMPCFTLSFMLHFYPTWNLTDDFLACGHLSRPARVNLSINMMICDNHSVIIHFHSQRRTKAALYLCVMQLVSHWTLCFWSLRLTTVTLKNNENSVIIYTAPCRWKVIGSFLVQKTCLALDSKSVLQHCPEQLK